jgi:hypothetical protein
MLNYLFSFYKIGHMAIIIGPSDIKPCPSPLTTQPGYKASLATFVCSVYSSDLDAATHGFQQPFTRVHTESLEVEV